MSVVEELNKFSCSFGDDDEELLLVFGKIATGCCKFKNDGLNCDDDVINEGWDVGVVVYGK